MLITTSRKLAKRMQQATSYAEWLEAAGAYDEKSGAQRWKNMDASRRFDYRSIRRRLDELRGFRERKDNIGLLFTLNQGIHGNMGGMGSARLYGRAKVGTKNLVSEYVDEINSALIYLASDKVEDISFDQKREFFHRASLCYGRTALMMSGSGSLLYFHVGVVKALWQEGLLPDVLSGSSGGAIIAGIVGTHKPDELSRMFEPDFLLSELKQEASVWKNFSLLKPRTTSPEQLREILERLIPDVTFQESQALTGRTINVSVAPAETHQSSRLLNAVASPNVYLHDALVASAAVPGIYPPVMLMAKNVHGEKQPYLPSRRWVDGSITEDLPAKRLSRLYGVNHFIVSQTNPLALPFVRDSTDERGIWDIYRNAILNTGREWFNANLELFRKPLALSPNLERWMTMARSVMNQQYTADINILPDTRLVNPMHLLALRSEKEVMELITAGEKATWPKLEMIRIQTQISRTLDEILEQYEQAGSLSRHQRPVPRRAKRSKQGAA